MTTRPILLRGLGSVGDLVGPRAVLVADGRIAGIDADAERSAPSGARTLTADGLVAVPGFVELQLNGVAGHDFTTEPESMWRVGEALARRGVSAFLPTIVTSPPGTVDTALGAWRSGTARPGTPVPLGLHVEGPYLSPARHGAHDPDLVRPPDLDEVDRWLAGDGLRVLTLAPELAGGVETTARVAARDVVVSIGHTDADAVTVAQAIDAGARYATHLFNAMPPLEHRAPGPAGAVLADERVTVGIIVDGHHLHPIVVDLVARLAGRRMSLVSDAIAALGLPDGTHLLAGRSVEVRDGAARLADGTLAGSVAGLDDCVRACAAITGSPAAAVAAVTTTPARLLGLDDRLRGLEPGARADIVLLDTELGVRATIIGGEVAHTEESAWA